MGRRMGLGVAVAMCALAAMVVRAQEKKPAAPPAEYLVGEMHIQTVAESSYAYGSKQTTFEKIGEAIGALIPPLTKALDDGKVKQKGPIVFVYKGVDGADMSKPFTLEVGIETVDDAKPTDDLKVRKLSKFKCATMLYTGPLQNLGKVYEKLIAAALAAGHKPTGESREFYLYWEAPDSKNNVVQVQLGIE